MARSEYMIDHQSVSTIVAIMQNLAEEVNTNVQIVENGETTGASWDKLKSIAQNVTNVNLALQNLMLKTVEFLKTRNISIQEKDRENANNYMKYWGWK